MKLTLAIVALTASAASAYNVGGFETFGRPYFVTGSRRGGGRFGRRYGCSPQQKNRNGRCVDRAFEDLANELKSDKFRRGRRGPPGMKRDFSVDEETLRQQREWVSRAFGLASDVAKGMASIPDEAKEADEVLRQQKEWADRMFGFARDVSSGGEYSSVRSEVLQDDDEMFQVALDVPGVRASNIDVTVEGTKDKILVVRGTREVGSKGEEGEAKTRKFSKILSLDSRSDSDRMTADLEDGVLVLSIPRVAIENAESIQKVSVNKITDESTASSAESESFPFELEIDLPGVAASNVDITVQGDTDKTLVITAVREMGKDSEGKPKTKEISKSFKVDELVDTSKIVANLSNGVLKVSAPADAKKTEESVRTIVVKQTSDEANPDPVDSSQTDVVDEEADTGEDVDKEAI